MTTKRYRESRTLSRTQKPRRPFRLPDHFRVTEPARASEENPIDILVDRLPGMAECRQRVTRLRHNIQRQVSSQTAFITYEDARTDFAVRRERAFFNIGYERGHLAGLADTHEASARVDPAVRRFARDICHAVASSKVPMAEMAAALLDVARAVILASHGR